MANRYGEGSWYFNNAKIGGITANRSPNQQEIGNDAANLGGFTVDRGFDAEGDGLVGEALREANLAAGGADPKKARFIPDFFVDGTDALANKGFLISFQSTITGKNTHFKAFITAFNETYTSNWNQEEVYGRADPIYMYKNTVRNITLSFKVPAATEGEAYENLMRVQGLIQNLYPSYTNVNNASTIAQSPLVRMKVVNMTPAMAGQIVSPNASIPGALERAGGTETSVSPDAGNGLLGVIKNVSVTHNLENGDVGVFEMGSGQILPKLIEVNLDFGVIHEHKLAQQNVQIDDEMYIDGMNWDFTQPGFPYGATLEPWQAPMTKQQIKDDYTNNIAAYTERLQAQNEALFKRETAEQSIANADARYAGMFGKARFNKDMRRLENGKIKNDEKRAYISQTVKGEKLSRAYEGEQKWRDHQGLDPFDGLEDSQAYDTWAD